MKGFGSVLMALREKHGFRERAELGRKLASYDPIEDPTKREMKATSYTQIIANFETGKPSVSVSPVIKRAFMELGYTEDAWERALAEHGSKERGDRPTRGIAAIPKAASIRLEPIEDDGPLPVYAHAGLADIRTGTINFSAPPVAHQPRPRVFDCVRGVYAVIAIGSSMEPRFRPGETLYVNPWKQPRPGDYVVVRVRNKDGQTVGHVKRYVAQRGSKHVFDQLNPPAEMTLGVEEAEVHRIVGLADL